MSLVNLEKKKAERDLSGYAHLPQLLRDRAAEFDIPVEAFKAHFTFDRVGLWQIADSSEETFAGTNIIKSQMTKNREANQAPRGVVVSAGLEAMDYFRHHGIDLGHIVWFVRLSPWVRTVGVADGKIVELRILRAADIIASEDLAVESKNMARVPFEWNDGLAQHQYHGVKANVRRLDPTQSEDY